MDETTPYDLAVTDSSNYDKTATKYEIKYAHFGDEIRRYVRRQP